MGVYRARPRLRNIVIFSFIWIFGVIKDPTNWSSALQVSYPAAKFTDICLRDYPVIYENNIVTDSTDELKN